MNNIQFTIIVPFYDDTIETISETLLSIANQENYDLNLVQVILVNDGSKYNLQNIFNQYKDKIKNLEMYVKENGNWGSVVNFVKHKNLAKGKYISILDSDDKLAKNALENFANISTQNSDLLIGNIYYWKSKKNKKIKIFIYLFFWKKYYHFFNTNKKKHLFKTAFFLPLCKFYKSNIFYSIPDCEENVSFQDIFVYTEALKKVKTISYTRKYLGYYRYDRSNSSTNTKWNEKKLCSWKNVVEYLSQNENACISYFYLLIIGFTKEYKKYFKTKNNWPRIILKKKFKCCYVSKPLFLATKIFTFFIFLKNKSIIERK